MKATHGVLVLAVELGAGQELLILGERDYWLRELPEIKLQQRGHGVHICITAGERFLYTHARFSFF